MLCILHTNKFSKWSKVKKLKVCNFEDGKRPSYLRLASNLDKQERFQDLIGIS